MDWHPLRGDGSTLWGKPFFGDARLDRQLADLSGVLWRAEGGARYLAIPYAPDAPFPLTEMFCFARLERLGGRGYVVYCVDADGMPLA